MKRAILLILTGSAMLWACDGRNQHPQGGEGVEIGERLRSSPLLQAFGSCSELEMALKASLKEEMRVRLLMQENNWHYRLDGEAAPTAGNDDSGGGRQEGVDYSGTNNQEAGVDEADFVKTDGYHIYLINGHRLEILGTPTIGGLEKEGSLELEGRPSQMLLNDAGESPADVEDDRLVIFSSIYVWNLPQDHPLREIVGEPDNAHGWWYRTSTLSKITVVDISDRNAPTVVRELFIEGYYQTARRVQSTVRMVSYGWMDIAGLRHWPELPEAYWGVHYDDPIRKVMWDHAVLKTIEHNDAVIDAAPLSDFIPQIYERLGDDTFSEHTFTDNSCADFSIPGDGFGHGVASIMSLDLLNAEFAFDADHIISNWSTVYASTDILVLAEPANDWWWYWNNVEFEEATNIHRFDISEAGITDYTGSGRTVGQLWDQFQISEYEGNIRVATTSGWWWRWWVDEEQEPVQNHISVLAGDQTLEVVGHVGGIAVDERIWSCRFVGDKGFLVTFRNIDPLWTIDLSDPTNPTLVGDLHVPGVSTYIHPIEGDHLLTIGYGGNDTGLNWATQLSLFDVNDFGAPATADTLTFNPLDVSEGWSYSFSEATWEHKAFQYWAPLGMLAIPLSTYRNWFNPQSGYWEWEYSSLLQLVTVGVSAGLDTYGSVDHSDFFNSDPNRRWAWRDVRRSIFMRDNQGTPDETSDDVHYIYAISDRGVTAHQIDGMIPTASVALPGSADTYYWYY